VIRGDHTTDIDPFSFGKKFDISISGKYAEQNEQVFTDVHLYYVIIPMEACIYVLKSLKHYFLSYI
jgi:hypothetical protein